MRISEICIKRPVFATVVNLILVLIGFVCYDRLPVREYPNIDVPVVTVETRYRGASAEIIESQVTKPLEDSLSGIEGVDFLSSISRSEVSQITVQFRLERDADSAANDVRDRVARARGQLPQEIEEPIVAKTEADANPIIWLAFSSDRHSPLEVTDFADRIVRIRLQTLPGVSNVLVFAKRRYSMRIWLDKMKVAAYNLTTHDIENALRSQNVEIPSGRVESVEREFTVLSTTDLKTVEEFENVILRNDNGYLVRIKDVARVEVGPEEERQIARYNGEQSIALGVIKQSVANPLDVSDAVRAAIPQIEKIIPEGMKVSVAYDQAVFIRASIKSVYITIIEAVSLVTIVILFFLRSFRSAVIPLLTIPISLIVTFALLYIMGFTVNTLTLLAMVLAIGLVVDDAIVVLENIHRHIEEGTKPILAAIQGIREIGFAVVAMTLTLAAVFAPVAFTPGRTGKLFTEFALTLAGAVIVSGFTALTLSPMMCSRILGRKEEKHSEIYNKIEKAITGTTTSYSSVLGSFLKWISVHKYFIFIFITAVVFLSALLSKFIPSELAPMEDRGVIFGVGIAPEGSTIEHTDKYARQMEKIFEQIPEKRWLFTAVGFPVINNMFVPVGFKPWSERDRNVQEIIAELGPKMFGGIAGIISFPVSPPPLGQNPRSRPIEFVIQTSLSYEELQGLVGGIMGQVYQNHMFAGPDVDLKLNKPELKINIDRDKAATVGVNIEDIGRTLETMLGGREVNKYKSEGEQYKVIVQLDRPDRANPGDIDNIFIRGKDGQIIQLSSLLAINEGVAPRELNHFNKLRSATISANLAPGASMNEALAFLEKITLSASPELHVDYGGVSREFKLSSSSLATTFLLALGFIYLVLAAQFESWVDPFVIMLSVPLAIVGALLTLMIFGGTLNVYSQIGLVTLVGLITKHGILIVEFANQLQEKGRGVMEAAIESATIRLRPILMTTGAMVLGSIPLAFASGAGAESRQQIGLVIVGGMSIGTLFTLFVVPTFYILLARKRDNTNSLSRQ